MPSLGLKRVLYIEDDEAIRMIVSLALRSIGGMSVQTYGTAREALETVESFEPHMILLDAMMPDMDGAETLRALRNLPQTADTPIVFITAKLPSEGRSYFHRLGAQAVIFKPFDPMQLPARLHDIWGEAR